MGIVSKTVNLPFDEITGQADAGDGHTVYTVNYGSLPAFYGELRQRGWSFTKSITVGETQGAAYTDRDNNGLYLYLNAKNEAVKAVYGTRRTPEDNASGSTLYVDTVLYQAGNLTPKNSMTYIIRLRDGRFIIIDGGIELDPEGLFAIMRELSPLCSFNGECEKPNVAAWILTHPHNDHVTLFCRTMNEYRNRLTLEKLFVNFPSDAAVSSRDHAALCQCTAVRSLFRGLTDSGCEIYKPYAGQSFVIGGLRFDVLYSQAEWLFSDMTTVNDASLVIKLTGETGRTILFLADVMARGGDMLMQMYGSRTLKSDIVQIAHHGMYGSDYTLYSEIEAGACLWPVSAAEYRQYGENIQRNIRLRSLKIPHYISNLGCARISV